jgi:hypothetical protein
MSSKSRRSIRKENDLWKSKHLIKSITNILNEIIEENENDEELEEIIFKQSRFCFNSTRPPVILIENYIERILKYTKCEESTLILSLIYIDKICQSNNLLLTNFNTHRYINI